ncbi:bis(5'-nucleosyl)-tetraphosphatase [asymmetrical]-like [Physella acuta]|uniref:bis(5'-nucleosyl)-tetraphosphatase [asymmetrical]-like n=1 Tax=Physella acuta TaxID=109671 RepID=UPI0027DD89EC|nr:bis(5'-nucleosyl)-tetraphosphatase [asymmetrical]-like [Physella acuta]
MATSNLVAAGLLIFRRLHNKLEYLLLQTSYGENHWTPPKGHVDPGETEFETAIRETEEESGFKKEQLKILTEFERNLVYNVNGKPKRVVYWLSELCNPNDPVRLSSEHQDFKWLHLDEACTLVKYPDMAALLKEANKFLLELYKS